MDISRKTSSRIVHAGVGFRLTPTEKDSGFTTAVELKRQDVDDADQQHCIEAAFQGALDALLTHHLHPVLDVRITLVFFSYDKPQSSRVAFWEAGRDAARKALGVAGGIGMTEAKENFDFVARR